MKGSKLRSVCTPSEVISGELREAVGDFELAIVNYERNKKKRGNEQLSTTFASISPLVASTWGLLAEFEYSLLQQQQRQRTLDLFKMPGTHLLPPNLLKLFAPRPPLPYKRPVDRDIDRIRNKNVSGVAAILAQLREATTESLITAGVAAADTTMEEGEEPAFTHAEEIKRQIRREDRKKKRTEEFKIAKETCECSLAFSRRAELTICLQINPLTTRRPLGIHIKLYLSLAW